MAITVRTRRKFDKLTPSEELVVRLLEGLPIPRKLEAKLRSLKRVADERKSRKSTKTNTKARRKTSSW